jgi:nucleotide-binding universal stress UspA family protein
MFQHILLPTDGSLLSAAAVESGLGLAREAGAKVTVVTVVEPVQLWWTPSERPPEGTAAVLDHANEGIRHHLAEVERKAKAHGVPCTVLQVEHEQPYRAIIDTARKAGCDLIAMASHGRRGVSALMVGSETTKVLTHSSIPVLVYR